MNVLEISLHSTFLATGIKPLFRLVGGHLLHPALISATLEIYIDSVMSEPNLSNLKSPPACSAWNPSIPNGFGYRPSLAAGIVFTILFSCTLALHLWQTARQRNFWLGAAFSIGALGEVIGWGARVAAYPCPYSTQLMEMQLAALIMGKLQSGLDSYLLVNFTRSQRSANSYQYSACVYCSRYLRHSDASHPSRWQRQIPSQSTAVPHHLHDCRLFLRCSPGNRRWHDGCSLWAGE